MIILMIIVNSVNFEDFAADYNYHDNDDDNDDLMFFENIDDVPENDDDADNNDFNNVYDDFSSFTPFQSVFLNISSTFSPTLKNIGDKFEIYLETHFFL